MVYEICEQYVFHSISSNTFLRYLCEADNGVNEALGEVVTLKVNGKREKLSKLQSCLKFNLDAVNVLHEPSKFKFMQRYVYSCKCTKIFSSPS